MPEKQRYWDRKNNGLCVRCGLEKQKPGYVTCKRCYIADRIRDYCYRHQSENREIKRERERRRTQKHRETYRCSTCGRALNDHEDNGYLSCVFCRHHLHPDRYDAWKLRKAYATYCQTSANRL